MKYERIFIRRQYDVILWCDFINDNGILKDRCFAYERVTSHKFCINLDRTLRFLNVLKIETPQMMLKLSSTYMKVVIDAVTEVHI